jgi:hypothetical protein
MCGFLIGPAKTAQAAYPASQLLRRLPVPIKGCRASTIGTVLQLTSASQQLSIMKFLVSGIILFNYLIT